MPSNNNRHKTIHHPKKKRQQGKKEGKKEQIESCSYLKHLPICIKSGGYLLSHRSSTIGVIGLNFSVRNG